MAKQVINVGTSANDGTGDKIRVAFQKTNANFTELYDSKIDSVVAGTNVTVDNTDPLNPIVSATGGGGSQNLQQVTDVGNTVASGDYLSMVSANLIEVVNVITNTGSSITPDDGISIKTDVYKSNVKTDNLTVDRIHQLPDADGTLALTSDVTDILTTTITDGDTTHAPDGNSVFDALATKEPTITAGTTSQYWRGDKTWQTLPSGASGGSSISYYLNGGTAASVATYYQMSKIPVIGTGVDFSLAGNGLISQWLTDVADPNRLEIPAGNWNFEMYMSASSSGGTPAFYVELLKYNGTTFTTIANSSAVPEAITGGTSIDLYLTSLAIPQTTLLVTDRLAIRVYIVTSVGGRTITMHTQDSHLCQIITNFAGGVTSLNGLTANTQYFDEGTSGLDFNIDSTTTPATHIFNLPDAGPTARGVITTLAQTIAGAKTFSSNISIPATGSQLILSVSSGGSVSGLDLATYPSLTELATVKGVTSAIQTQINLKQDLAVATTGAVISFATPQIYNTFTSPTALNITDSLGTAKIGVVQKIYSNKSVEPTYPAGWKKLAGTYIVNVPNIIYCEWCEGSRVEYWIVTATV